MTGDRRWKVVWLAGLVAAAVPGLAGPGPWLQLTRLANGELAITVAQIPTGQVARVWFASELGPQAPWTMLGETSAGQTVWQVPAALRSGFFRIETVAGPVAEAVASTPVRSSERPTPPLASVLPTLIVQAGNHQRGPDGLAESLVSVTLSHSDLSSTKKAALEVFTPLWTASWSPPGDLGARQE
jgi:hypothetical protein